MSGIPESAGGDVFLDGDNEFTGTNTFNSSRPTSTLTDTPSATDFLTKQNADNLYGTGSGDVLAAGNNVFTGTNSFNTNRPTSTLTTTPNSTDFITKADADTLYNTQITTNTSNIATNTSNIATNTSDIANNTINIATNTSNIATNTSNIATNTSNIATNTSNIATNTSNIATNTSDIATLDGEAVKITGNQTIAGVKTFSSFPQKSGTGTDLDPTADAEFATKQYVDDTAGTPANMVTTDTTQTITGSKTFDNLETFFNYRIIQSGGSTNNYISQSGSQCFFRQSGTSCFIEQTGIYNYIQQTQPQNKIITEGKIGIKTTNPTEDLEVVGTTFLQGTLSLNDPMLMMGGSTYQKGFAVNNDVYIRCVGVQSAMKTHNQYCALACGTFYAANAIRFGSDDRIKHNEQEIPDALDLIDQLKPYKYKKSEDIYDASYNGDISGNWEWEIGLIAQDILKIPYLSFAVGNDPDNRIHTLNYATFIGVLIQGVKDLNNKNKELETRIETLEARINALT
jgi:hypothetical protein